MKIEIKELGTEELYDVIRGIDVMESAGLLTEDQIKCFERISQEVIDEIEERENS